MVCAEKEAIVAKKEMTNEENYHFDVAGYLIVPGVLTAAELKACNQALDQVESADEALQETALLALRDHPVLAHYLEQICGEEFRLDQAPRLIGLDPGEAKTPLTGGGEWVDWSRAYRQHNGARFCQGVRALWALTEVGEGEGGTGGGPGQPQQHGRGPPGPGERGRRYGTGGAAGFAGG